METCEGIAPGQRHNGIAAPYLIEYVDMEALLAAKGFDNNRLRATAARNGNSYHRKRIARATCLVILPCIAGDIS